MSDLLDPNVRKGIVDEIQSEENKARKREHQKRFDVYNDRQDRYIIEKLRHEFSVKTVKEMRKVLSINLTRRIIDEQSSVYNQEPTREFSNASDKELEQIENLYAWAEMDTNMRMANKYYNLFDQCALMVMPKRGKVCVKALSPFNYDVIPDPEFPEKPMAYIMNVWNFDQNKTIRDSGDKYLDNYSFRDDANQKIAEDDDRKAAQERYVVWTKDVVFTMNGNGSVVNEQGIMANPIGMLPFIDIATEKDHQFFVRRGSSTTEFALEFSMQLSDLSNTARLQNYSQAIVFAQEQPRDMVIGPNHVLFMQLDPSQPDLSPRFEFASPSPDLSGSLELLETQLRLFLASKGLDPGTVSGKGEARSFSSGIERLLAMLDKFEASRSDFSLFRSVEEDAFDLMRAWSNELQGVSDETRLIDDLNVSRISDDVDISIKFHEPGIVRTQSEKEDGVIKLLDQGLMSRKEAVMELRGIDEDKAKEVLKEIDEVEIGGTEIQENESQPEDQP